MCRSFGVLPPHPPLTPNPPVVRRRMVRHETRREYNHWCKILRRGQDKVLRWARDPNGLAGLLAESPPERAIPHHLRPSNVMAEKAVGSTAGRLPACLSDISRNPTRQRPGPSFLDFPLEIRTMVYQTCVDYPTCRSMFDTFYTHQGEPKTPSTRPSAIKAAVRLHTPTILLLCKHISREALDVLRTRPLVIDQIPPWVFGQARPLPLGHFISRPTLQKVKYIDIRVALGEGSQGSGHVWIEILGDLLEALAPHNSVIQLQVMAKLSHVDHLAVWNRELKLYELMVQMVRCPPNNDVRKSLTELVGGGGGGGVGARTQDGGGGERGGGGGGGGGGGI